MKNFSTIFDCTVTDDDLWDMATEMFAAVLIGMVLSLTIYLAVTL